MKLIDIIQLGIANLIRMRTRTFFTVLGVIIGVGALSSMVSFGVGMQKNMEDAFKENDLFTSLNITSKKIDINEIASGNVEGLKENLTKETVVLNDSIVNVIKNLPNVDIAYPEINIPVSIKLYNSETNISIKAMPVEIEKYFPFKEMEYGEFFSSNEANEVILRKSVLRKMKIKLQEEDSSIKDTSNTFTILPVDSIIGKTLSVITKEVDVNQMRNPFAMMMNMQKQKLPVKDKELNYKIIGIIGNGSEFSRDNFGNGIYVPLENAKTIPNLGFSSVWDLFNSGNKDAYGSIYVRVNEMNKMDDLVKTLKDMNLNVFAFSDQLKEIKRFFLIMDSFLGAIGLIALVVAALGIINTMLMSILERTREIGIMKSIGGSESQIRTIFFVEASIIGFIGGVFGLVLGWLVTRLANIVMNAQIIPAELPKVNLFYFPLWLISGAILFSIGISLLAGMYPANRAAKIDPVKALRHD